MAAASHIHTYLEQSSCVTQDLLFLTRSSSSSDHGIAWLRIQNLQTSSFCLLTMDSSALLLCLFSLMSRLTSRQLCCQVRCRLSNDVRSARSPSRMRCALLLGRFPYLLQRPADHFFVVSARCPRTAQSGTSTGFELLCEHVL